MVSGSVRTMRPGRRTLGVERGHDGAPGGGEVEALGPLHRLTGRLHRPHAADPEGALSGVGPGDQVPDLVLDHQAQRVHDALGHRAVAAGVAQPDLHGLDHRLLE